jgi:hypothetical protein
LQKKLKLENNSGYSGTPLAKKLGIKEGFTIRLVNEPENYEKLFSDFPDNVLISNDLTLKKDLIHAFVTETKIIDELLFTLKNEIVQNGIIWISWYKKAAKMPSDVNEDIIRNMAIETGLVDVKVCAVDDLWSGLKLVIPVKNRQSIQ